MNEEQPRNLRRRSLLCLALGLITFALYLPSLRHDFIGYDDQQYVTENSRVQAGLTRDGVVWAFGFHASNWHPLTWLSHMMDCRLYGLNPLGHHLTNVLLHSANTLLLFLVLHHMTNATWRSALVAALFAWHPLHVESVAWVAERKDVLSAFFWMLTLWAYIHHAEKSKVSGEVTSDEWRVTDHAPRTTIHYSRFITHHSLWYILAVLFFALGLMSKPMVVTLPLVLLLLDFWPLRRLQFKTQNAKLKTALPLVWEKLPFFALAAAACALTISAQRQGYSLVSTAGLPVGQRTSHALISYAHYLGAMVVPRNLAVYYPYETGVSQAQIFSAGLLLAFVTLLVLRFATCCPYLATGWFWYVGTLVPAIGLVQVGDQAWADRYTYLPLIGVFIAIVWGAHELAGTKAFLQIRGAQSRRAVLRLLTVAIGAAMLTGTSLQLRHWKNTRRLFEHAAGVTRNNHMAITLLGSLLAQEGKLDEAIEHYHAALRYKPGYPEAHFFLGNALDQRGKLDEAIAEYKQALWFKPTQEQTHIFLGIALAKQKKYDEAVVHYQAALKLNPESAVAHSNLARLLHLEGRLDEAIEHYSAALKLNPKLAQAHNNLGILLLQKGKLAEGAAQFREALRLDAENPETQYNLALALNQQRQWKEAAGLFAKTVGGGSIDPNAHYQFAVALVHVRQTRDAMSHYASALLIRSDFPDALDGLSWILATAAEPEFRNGTEAVRMAERACELTGRKDPAKLKTLAAAYAEARRFSEAIATAQQAEELASSAERKELAAECRLILETFKSAKPWRITQAAP